ncbi:MAG: hypothetical protein GX219_05990 [Tissierellia bacterium]|nr:hypothetical protein [Tissierellia bacterium]
MIFRLILFFCDISLAVIMYYEMMVATREKNGVVIATTFSNEMLQDERVENCIEKTRRGLKLALALSILISLPVLIPQLTESYTVIYFVSVIFIIMILLYIPIIKGFKYLRKLKSDEGWVVGARAKITIDTKLSLLGNSQAFPTLAYVFPIAIIFLGIYLNKAEETRFAMIITGFCIIFSQLVLHLVYRNRKNLSPTSDSELNIRINEIRKGKSTRLIYALTLVMSISFLVFSIFMNKDPYNITPFIVFMLSLSIGILFTVYRIQVFDREAEKLMPSQEELVDQDQFYDIWGYKNPDDPRVFVEPRIGSKQDINRGNPKGKAIYYGSAILTLVLVIGSFFLFVYSTNVEYKLNLVGDVIKIEAPLYGLEIQKDDILEINYLDKPPEGKSIRVNGVGASSQSYGNFSIQGYGPVKLYHYAGVGQYIEIITKDKKILYSEPTVERTKEKYEEIKSLINE